MTILVLFILAVIWAAVLVPPYLQNRSESRPADSISSFQKQLSVLERRATTVNPGMRARPAASANFPAARRPAGANAYAGSRSAARKRRRDVLFTLAGSAGVTLLAALAMGGPIWMLHLLVDALLAGYVFLLAQMNQRSMEQQAKVRYLPTARHAAPEPQLLLRRSGS